MRLIEPSEFDQVRGREIPAHVALIMDGNGRWASYKGLDRTDGHLAAREPMMNCIDAALELGTSWLTFFAFSTENWTRPPVEVQILMDFATWFFTPETVSSLVDRGVRIHFIGDTSDARIKSSVRLRFHHLKTITSENSRLELVIAFNYGGQQEILDAVKRAALAGANLGEVDESILRRFFYLPTMPPVDLLVRTSGEQRLSNFLLWHLAYTEMLFLDTLWPEFSKGHFYTAVADYQRRQRRFGGIPRPTESRPVDTPIQGWAL
ncbi:polyprenyl diphosphate synthase [Micromonospora chokoriensis]|uniref:polyprenyl diphosphate synthase n=1 Tax=Micromonospora chokoriensis TaxID=356851 RepID=UPI0006906ABF|nr:polyprenyl diphosphate synthase [Micromonospora chokoriensis]